MTPPAPNEVLAPLELVRVAQLLGARCGLRFDETNRDLLLQGLLRAAAVERLDVRSFVQRLEGPVDDALLQSLVRHVTVGETYFFRHPEHFELLRKQILPERIEARRDVRVLRAWSAGCSTGEEAYSLASTLTAAAGDAFTVGVLGTDINRTALERARLGDYGPWSLRGELPAGTRHLDVSPDRSIAVGAELKRLVRFDYLNLRDPIYPSLFTHTTGLDVIFCRNVLVYFFSDQVVGVLERFSRCLADGGYLLTSALDIDFARRVPALEVVRVHGSPVLRKRPTQATVGQATRSARPTPRALPTTPSPSSGPPTAPSAPAPAASSASRARVDETTRHAMAAAKAAADAGDLDRAVQLARQAVAHGRSPEALHLLALVLVERGENVEPTTLLLEALAGAPDYVLGHLMLGLRGEGKHHLERAVALIGDKPDHEMLPGPEPLPVSWVRKMARVGLKS